VVQVTLDEKVMLLRGRVYTNFAQNAWGPMFKKRQ